MARSEIKIEDVVDDCSSRVEMWSVLIEEASAAQVAEIGVYKGDFAEAILKNCACIENYIMVDPWRNLEAWNKPANTSDEEFEEIFKEAKNRTDFASDRRTILRGKTTEVIDQIPDESLDFAYIDADHTLRGIAVDLLRVYPKVKTGGWIGGDDFVPTIWQHSTKFEPTFVFPYTVYFAEAMSDVIYALPHSQFLILKEDESEFNFIDIPGQYDRLDLRPQLTTRLVKRLAKDFTDKIFR